MRLVANGFVPEKMAPWISVGNITDKSSFRLQEVPAGWYMDLCNCLIFVTVSAQSPVAKHQVTFPLHLANFYSFLMRENYFGKSLRKASDITGQWMVQYDVLLYNRLALEGNLTRKVTSHCNVSVRQFPLQLFLISFYLIIKSLAFVIFVLFQNLITV